MKLVEQVCQLQCVVSAVLSFSPLSPSSKQGNRMVSVAERKKRKNTSTVSKRVTGAVPGARNKVVFIAVAASLAAVSICYANALANGFVFDDQGHVLSDVSLRSLSSLSKFLPASYRPIRDISYALDFAVWGARPFGFHLTSVLIHLANTLLVFALIRRLTREVLPATLTALVFALQPVQVDAVTYISGRRDVLFCLFYLASFHCYLTYRESAVGDVAKRLRTNCYFALTLLLWGLSLFTKEMAASLPAFIFVWNSCDAWEPDRKSWVRRFFSAARKALARDRWLYVLVLLAVPAYVWYQVVLKGGSERARVSGIAYWGGSFYTNLLTSIRVHAWYLKQLVLPTPIVQYSGGFDIATTLLDPRVILSIIAVGATAAGGFLLLSKDRLMAFAVLSYFVLLLPVSHVIPHHELLADHYLYLPMMSFGLFVALLTRKLASRGEIAGRVAYGAAAAALIVFGAMTVLRNPVYKDDFALWKTSYNEVPNSLRAVYSLAGQYATSYPARGAELYKKCIALDPSYSPAYLSLAVLYQTKEKAREAEEIIQRGLALPDSRVVSPDDENPNRFRSELTTALAVSKGFQGSPKEGEALLIRAIDLDPTNSQAYELLAGYYHSVDIEKEIAVLKRQVETFPTDTYSLQTLSSRFIEAKRYDDALPYLQRLLAIIPGDFFANYEMGQIHRTKNDCSAARGFLTVAKAAASNPEDTKAIDDALKEFQQQCGGS